MSLLKNDLLSDDNVYTFSLIEKGIDMVVEICQHNGLTFRRVRRIDEDFSEWTQAYLAPDVSIKKDGTLEIRFPISFTVELHNKGEKPVI